MSQNVDELRDCPYCAEPIKARAILCKHCGSKVQSISDHPPETSAFAQPISATPPLRPILDAAPAPTRRPPVVAVEGGFFDRLRNIPFLKTCANYALTTAIDSAKLGVKQIFPLFIGWFVTMAIPALAATFLIIGATILDKMGGSHGPGVATMLASLASAAIFGLANAAFSYLTLRIARGLPWQISDLLRPVNQVISCFVVAAITAIGTSIAGFFLVVPGAYLYLKWQLAPLYVVDRNYGPIEALKASWQDTDRVFISLSIMDLGFFAIGAVTAGFTFGISLVLANMLATVSTAIVFSRWLSDEDHPEFAGARHLIEQSDHERFNA